MIGPLALKLEETYTYGDYLQWNDGERWELIDGVPYNMSPAAHGERPISSSRFSLPLLPARISRSSSICTKSVASGSTGSSTLPAGRS